MEATKRSGTLQTEAFWKVGIPNIILLLELSELASRAARETLQRRTGLDPSCTTSILT